MHSNSSNQDLIHQMQQQIHYMHKYIQHLNQYINQQNVYEYYIQGLNVGKVTGTLQLGQLIKNELKDRDGLHRFIIGEINIREIEGTGTVGLGVMEKEDAKQPPSENDEELNKLYEELKIQLHIEEVPAFLKSIEIGTLTKIQTWMGSNLELNETLTAFYENILFILNERINPVINIATPSLSEDTYIELADEIEIQAKSLFVISTLLQIISPGYIEKYKNKSHFNTFEQAELDQTEKPVTSQQIIEKIKKGFRLKNLPFVIEEELDESPETLRYFFHHIVQPIVESGDAALYIGNILALIIKSTGEFSEEEIDLNIEEQSNLFSQLINFLDEYIKHILLEYLLLQI
ncbi:hypothetical protein [Metabacillus litoralis]|uniref:hypothetical protein n=1 Tax=Metabacillus litoralis TaxID=152268 RepID=UPI000EF565CF|nr:hypothetical protein [Metabacillus litoralis]